MAPNASGAGCGHGTPHRLVVTFQIGPGWVYQPDPGLASEIEVRFTAEGPRRTRVEFEHRHLERYAEDAERMRAVLSGPNGVSQVLAAYAAAVTRTKHQPESARLVSHSERDH